VVLCELRKWLGIYCLMFLFRAASHLSRALQAARYPVLLRNGYSTFGTIGYQ